DEAILTDGHELADERMRLHTRSRADHGTLLDLGERADEAIVANSAAVEVAGFDDLDPGAERHVTNPDLMKFGGAHDATPRRLSLGAKCNATSWPVSIDSYSAVINSRLLRPSRPSTRAA